MKHFTARNIFALASQVFLAFIAFVALETQVLAHNGDLQGLLSRPQPTPFVGGQPVMVQGELEVIHGDDFTGSRSFIRYFVRSFATHELLELGFDSLPSAELLTGRHVTVRGRRQDSVIWVKDVVPLSDSGTSAQSSGTVEAAPVLTERSAVAILINLTDAVLCADITTCTYKPAYIAGQLFTNAQSVRSLYLNSSYQQVTFKTDTNNDGQPDVVGPYNLALSKVGCNWSQWGAAADSAATAAGVNLSLYQHKIYVISSATQTDCGWAGLAYVGGSQSYVSEPQSMMVYAHELGHNLNMAHAGTDPENDNVMNAEYGDSSDPMGSSRAVHNFNGPHTHQMGWFNAFTNAVQSVTASGLYSIAPIGNTPDGTLPQTLRIAKPSTGDYYYLSYRQPAGFDATLSSTYTQGVNVHHYKGSGYAYTYFIQSLGDNGLFTDAVNGISVTQSTHGTSATTIQVTFGCAALQPSVGIAPATVWAKSGSTVSLSAQVSNRDSAGCAATTFQLTASSNLSASSLTVTPGSLSSVAPGQSASATLTVAGVTSSGTVTLTAHDSDGADPSHPQDGVGTAQIQIDATAPSAPTNLSASLAKTGVKLTWTASTDGGSGVATYYVYRNGVQIGSTSNRSYTDTSGVGGTSYTYTVTALDVVGNESGNSNSVTVTYPKKGRR
jgi:hypothetical protein